MNIFKRLFKIFQTRANIIVNNLENPVDVIEQKLEDLREDFSENLDSLKKVKALAIRTKNDKENYLNEIKIYEERAINILKQAQINKIDINDANRLAREALTKKEVLLLKIKANTAEQDRLDYKVELLKGTISIIESNISDLKNELKSLKTEVRLKQAEETIHNQIGNSDTISIGDKLTFLKETVSQYQHLKEQDKNERDDSINIDDVDFTLDETRSKVNKELKQLKQQLGIKTTD